MGVRGSRLIVGLILFLSCDVLCVHPHRSSVEVHKERRRHTHTRLLEEAGDTKTKEKKVEEKKAEEKTLDQALLRADECTSEFTDMEKKWVETMGAILTSSSFPQAVVNDKKQIIRDALAARPHVRLIPSALSVDVFHRLFLAVILLGLVLNFYGVVHVIMTFTSKIKDDFAEAIVFLWTIAILFVVFAVLFWRRNSLSIKNRVISDIEHLEKLDYTPVTHSAVIIKQCAYLIAFLALLLAIIILVVKESGITSMGDSKTQFLGLTAVVGFLTAVLRFITALWSESLENSFVKGMFVPLSTMGEELVVLATRKEVWSWCNDTDTVDRDHSSAFKECSTTAMEEKSAHLEALDSLAGTIDKAYACRLAALIKPVSAGADILYDTGNALGVLTMILHFD